MSLLDLLLPLRSKKKPPTTTGDAAGAAALAAVIGPGAVEVGARYVRVGDGYASTLVVTGYPTEVGPAWLEPLLAWPGRLDVTLHIEPIPTAAAANRLRRQRARLESSRRFDADKGRLGDPQTDAAADDAADLADRLARGQSRLFRVGVYLTLHAMTPQELADAVAESRPTPAPPLPGP